MQPNKITLCKITPNYYSFVKWICYSNSEEMRHDYVERAKKSPVQSVERLCLVAVISIRTHSSGAEDVVTSF